MQRITLSFDNGPHLRGTPQLLRVLTDRSLTATFFFVGERLQDPALRDIAERVRDAGHRIGNHSLTHGEPLGRRPGFDVAEREIGQAQALLAGLTTERLFRPNGDRGVLNEHLLSAEAVQYLEQHGYTAVCWNCVPQDWIEPKGSWVARAEAMVQQQDWSAIVLHDHCLADSMADLEGFLDRLIERGCAFTTNVPLGCRLVDRGLRTEALRGLCTPPMTI